MRASAFDVIPTGKAALQIVGVLDAADYAGEQSLLDRLQPRLRVPDFPEGSIVLRLGDWTDVKGVVVLN